MATLIELIVGSIVRGRRPL
jgi:hypothetical protein